MDSINVSPAYSVLKGLLFFIHFQLLCFCFTSSQDTLEVRECLPSRKAFENLTKTGNIILSSLPAVQPISHFEEFQSAHISVNYLSRPYIHFLNGNS